MAPSLRQAASNTVCKGQSRQCTVTFNEPTTEKNLVVLVCVAGGGAAVTPTVVPSGFTFLRSASTGGMTMTMWYWEGAPRLTSITVTSPADRSLQVRAMEYNGVAQSNALDRITVRTPASSSSDSVDTGVTGTPAQPDHLVVSVVANRHASTVQSGFIGGLSRLFESVSPQYFGLWGSNADSDRTRMTVHEVVAYAFRSWQLLCRLSSMREWISFIVIFRGGSSGPKRLTSTTAPPMIATNGPAGSAMLSAFGKFTSTRAAPVMSTQGGTATMLPFAYQYRANGLLLGVNTRYHVVSHDGLYGYTMRTSDDDQPRGDGALRGVDLQSAREILLMLEVDGVEAEVEQLLGVLYRAVTPQRDLDWEFVWRHPSQGARMIRCRPVELPREVTHDRTKLAPQAIQLRAADPRHYSAVAKHVEIPATPAGVTEPLRVSVVNAGDIPAYPRITIVGPKTGAAVNRVELVNETGLVTFDVQLTLPPRSVLVGDMEARVTGAPRSSITMDGQSKYGSWQLPRAPFRIDPAPYAIDGENLLYLRTDPPGADVTCTLDYRDTWAG